MSVRPSVHPSVRPSIRSGWASDLAGWPRGGTDRWTENLPILQDFVPYQGHCPASTYKYKEKVQQCKETADHLMPLGYLFMHRGEDLFFYSVTERRTRPVT